MIRYTPKGKIIPHKFTLEQLEPAMDLNVGFCRACGSEQDCVEPDARHYRCESCGMPQVYGAEELVLMEQVV